MANSEFLPFARPSITPAEIEAVVEVLESGWLTTGPRVKEFEEAFASYVDARHAVALNSATAGLHLAVEAIGVGRGDEVIVPTWTFTASAEVVAYGGGVPVLVDIEPETLNATPEAIAAAVGPKTKAVVAVHFAGYPLRISDLRALLDARGIALIEDAAHAFPSRVMENGETRFTGTIGRLGVYSFYATKTITTGEGGMLVTNDAALAERARLMSLHGISKDAWKRYSAAGSWYYEVVEAGYKYNLTDVAAALGLVQLRRADELLAERVRLARLYASFINQSPIQKLVALPGPIDDPAHAWHLFVLRLQLDALRVDRDAVIDQLRALGIGVSVHFIPLHMHPYYRRTYGYDDRQFPVATAEFRRTISLPLWPGMGDRGVERVVNALVRVLEAAAR
jgi:perosamine synthetase